MAKARTTDAATQIDPVKDRLAEALQAGVAQSQNCANPLDDQKRVVQINVPVTMHPLPTEFTYHVDCKLTPQQSTVARRIAQQLDFQNARLNNGQRIINVHGALKWLLEEIGEHL